MKTAKYVIGSLIACSMLAAGQVAYAGIAGNVQFSNGSVSTTNAAGQTHTLQKGDAINENDTVATGKNASAQIRMRDGGLIAVRPDSKIKFDTFVYSGQQDGTEKSLFTLFRGGMRAVTGYVGQLHKANYHINTPTTTIGIRGTDHEIFVVVPGSELAATVTPGTYNKVNVGGTVMTTTAGAVNVQPNQMGFAGAANQVPQLQPVNLNLFTVAPPPMAQAQGGNAPVRTASVVDGSVVQGLSIAPGTTAQISIMRTPIVGTYSTGGVISPATQHTVVF